MAPTNPALAPVGVDPHGGLHGRNVRHRATVFLRAMKDWWRRGGGVVCVFLAVVGFAFYSIEKNGRIDELTRSNQVLSRRVDELTAVLKAHGIDVPTPRGAAPSGSSTGQGSPGVSATTGSTMTSLPAPSTTSSSRSTPAPPLVVVPTSVLCKVLRTC